MIDKRFSSIAIAACFEIVDNLFVISAYLKFPRLFDKFPVKCQVKSTSNGKDNVDHSVARQCELL